MNTYLHKDKEITKNEISRNFLLHLHVFRPYSQCGGSYKVLSVEVRFQFETRQCGDLWRKKWKWNKIFFEYLGFVCQCNFTGAP
jgi:hypothetical protein